jgi:HEPN domain-containing protein
MNPWLEEANRLLRLARRDRLACATVLHVPELAVSVGGFHAQQAVEKALKAVMAAYGVEFRRTHDLEELAHRLSCAGHPSPVEEAQLARLTPYAVEFRYDDEAVALIEPQHALALVDSVIAWARERINLKGSEEE